MVYEVTPGGQADPIPGTEDEPQRVTAAGTLAGLTSLEDMTLPGGSVRRSEDWREPWATGNHPEWRADR